MNSPYLVIPGINLLNSCWPSFPEPDAYPSNVTGFDKSSTSLFVEWQHIPKHHRNGILLGYRISYFPNTSYQAVKHKTVDSTRSSTTLSNLKKFTWYVIKVAGYTSKGLGPHPPRPLEIRTSEDGKSRDLVLITRCFNPEQLKLKWVACLELFVIYGLFYIRLEKFCPHCLALSFHFLLI